MNVHTIHGSAHTKVNANVNKSLQFQVRDYLVVLEAEVGELCSLRLTSVVRITSKGLWLSGLED
jgi:hypothetical protein